MENTGGSALHVRDRAHQTEEQITENLVTLMHRTGMKAYQVAAAIGVSPQTIGRRLRLGDFPYWEVEALAHLFEVTLEEMTGQLPPRARWLEMHRGAGREDEPVRHQGLEPRTRCFESKSPDLRERHLRVV